MQQLYLYQAPTKSPSYRHSLSQEGDEGKQKPPAGPGEERGERCGGIFYHRFCPIGFWLPLGWIRNLLGKRKPQVLQDSVALTVALCGLCRQFTLYGFPSVLILVLG